MAVLKLQLNPWFQVAPLRLQLSKSSFADNLLPEVSIAYNLRQGHSYLVLQLSLGSEQCLAGQHPVSWRP